MSYLRVEGFPFSLTITYCPIQPCVCPFTGASQVEMSHAWPLLQGSSQPSKQMETCRERAGPDREAMGSQERSLPLALGSEKAVWRRTCLHHAIHHAIHSFIIEPSSCLAQGWVPESQQQTCSYQTCSLSSCVSIRIWRKLKEERGDGVWKREWHLARESNTDKIIKCSYPCVQGTTMTFELYYQSTDQDYLNLEGISVTHRQVKAGFSMPLDQIRDLSFLFPIFIPVLRTATSRWSINPCRTMLGVAEQRL